MVLPAYDWQTAQHICTVIFFMSPVLGLTDALTEGTVVATAAGPGRSLALLFDTGSVCIGRVSTGDRDDEENTSKGKRENPSTGALVGLERIADMVRGKAGSSPKSKEANKGLPAEDLVWWRATDGDAPAGSPMSAVAASPSAC